eukprot:gene5931-6870_t
MLLATFLPSFDSTVFSTYQEVIRIVNGLVDVFAIHTLLQMTHAPKDVRAIGIGLGWAYADAIMVRLVPLWIGAFPLEFSWSHLIHSLESNTSSVHIIAITLLLGYLGLGKGSKSLSMPFANVLSMAPAATLSLLIFTVLPTIQSIAIHVFAASDLMLLALNVAVVATNVALVYAYKVKSSS